MTWLESLAAKYIPPTAPVRSPRPTGEALAARVRAYLKTIPAAVAGQRGHDRTFYAAGRLVRGFDLTPDAAYPYLAEWNATCNPPWSDTELRHKLAEAAKQPGPRGFLLDRPVAPGRSANPAQRFRNFALDEIRDGDTVRAVPRGRPGSELLEELTAFTGGWPKRVGGLLFARSLDGNLVWMKRASELFAWIDSQYGGDGRSGFEWAGGKDCLNREDFYTHCQQNAECWDHVELYPHEPRISGHYYFHPEPAGGDGKALDELVDRFRPATAEDQDLIRLFFVTLVWGGSPGQRPVFLFESDADAAHGGRGSGKTTVAIMGARLVGGMLMISPRENLKDVHSRLLSPEGLTKRVALVDNLKTLRYSDADLEGMITSPVISGRQMYVGEGQRPNSLVWVVTSNRPSLSKDLSMRAVIIRVTTPVYKPEWERDTNAMIEARRWEIIGDCLAEIRRTPPTLADQDFTRWGQWERDILSKSPDPARLAALLAERRKAVDDDDDLSDEIQDAIKTLIRNRGFDPERDAVLIPSQVIHDEIVKKFAGSHITRGYAMKWLYTMGVQGVSKHDADKPYRGAVWRPPSLPNDSRVHQWSDRFGTNGLPD